MRKFNIKASKTKLHNLWSLYIRKRDGFKCQWCLKHEEPANAHHIVAKSICQNAGRFDIQNGVTLCVYCHINRLPTDPDNYIIFRDKWLKDRGLDYLELKRKYLPSVKFTKEFYDKTAVDLTLKIAELED